MSGLHRFLYHCEQLFVELAQVNLVAQGGIEGCQGAGRIVLAPVETAVDSDLNAMAQRLKDCV